MVSKKEVAAAFNAAAEALGVDGNERGDLLFVLSKLSEEQLDFFPIGADNTAIVAFARSAKASATGLGVGSASGAGTAAHISHRPAASAANQGTVPLLGTDDDGSWFWVLFKHFAAVADRYPSPHRRQHQD
ncbi:hypothetical protein CHLRE_13g577750v5 [Chlamydomonas reinhardtii]|uniref:Uncharacterized protein n=1 Tax=Chlamydomonas reinhardtii TaxID=3055 RepID=A0A2K3D090_CHLRE|nr:uncharacterized protein CHLRE_13g577750v5 [Chlamydomonas reinhardtii]PNW73909.1 hypothetical protein CHLRE_13g577750v5 [Chlamydomonas reinhardtii]